MRKIYLDNIRWATVLLVMAYHVFYMFNSVGILGGVGSFSEVQYQDAVMTFVYPWFMILLFVIAGISARYALNKKSVKKFLSERTQKLLVPSTLGLFAFQWIVGYYNITIGGAVRMMPQFMVYPISVISGIGPLWFVQMLWLFSLVSAILKAIDRENRLLKIGKNCNTVILVFLAIPLWGSSQILNAPVLIMYRFGIYFVSYFIGYFILSHDDVKEKLEKIHIPALIIAVITGIAYTIFYFGMDFTSNDVLRSLFTNAYAWIMVLAILSCGKAWFNKENTFTKYMVKSSYGFYILHYAVVLITCYYLKTANLSPALIYISALIIVFTVTPALYEIIKRIPFYRWLVLGIKKDAVKS